MDFLGLEGEIPVPGRALVRGTLKPEHLNSWASAHGGFVYAMADAAFALASNSHGAMAVAIATNMEYIRPTRAGERLEAEAAEVHLGRRTSVYRVEVRGEDGLVALFTGTAYRRPERPSPLFPEETPPAP